MIYWSNIVAWVLQPALFLHFVLTFPEKRQFVRKHPWLLAAGVVCPERALVAGNGTVTFYTGAAAASDLRWDMDRQEMAYGAILFLAAAWILWDSYRRAGTTILRQQLKWVTRGTFLAILPCTGLYVLPYFNGLSSSSGRG